MRFLKSIGCFLLLSLPIWPQERNCRPKNPSKAPPTSLCQIAADLRKMESALVQGAMIQTAPFGGVSILKDTAESKWYLAIPLVTTYNDNGWQVLSLLDSGAQEAAKEPRSGAEAVIRAALAAGESFFGTKGNWAIGQNSTDQRSQCQVHLHIGMRSEKRFDGIADIPAFPLGGISKADLDHGWIIYRPGAWRVLIS